jgi:ketosteroid isomerase-like protein
MTTTPERVMPLSESTESTEPARLVNARRFLMGITSDSSTDVLSLLAPDVVYTVSGHGPLAGVFHGPTEVDAHFGRLFRATSGTLDVLKSVDWLVGMTHVAAIQFVRAQANGVIYRSHQMFVFETDQRDLLTRIRLFFQDQDSADVFLAKVPRP